MNMFNVFAKINRSYELKGLESFPKNFNTIVSGHNWMRAFSPQAIVYCYLEFKLSYLKNLKLFSITVK